MKFEFGENSAGAAGKCLNTRAVRLVVIGAFAAGVAVGGAVAIGLLLAGRAAGRVELGIPRPRRLLIGNLEIEERGDDTRFRVD